jgi:hypothetical protein
MTRGLLWQHDGRNKAQYCVDLFLGGLFASQGNINTDCQRPLPPPYSLLPKLMLRICFNAVLFIISERRGSVIQFQEAELRPLHTLWFWYVAFPRITRSWCYGRDR